MGGSRSVLGQISIFFIVSLKSVLTYSALRSLSIETTLCACVSQDSLSVLPQKCVLFNTGFIAMRAVPATPTFDHVTVHVFQSASGTACWRTSSAAWRPDRSKETSSPCPTSTDYAPSCRHSPPGCATVRVGGVWAGRGDGLGGAGRDGYGRGETGRAGRDGWGRAGWVWAGRGGWGGRGEVGVGRIGRAGRGRGDVASSVQGWSWRGDSGWSWGEVGQDGLGRTDTGVGEEGRVRCG